MNNHGSKDTGEIKKFLETNKNGTRNQNLWNKATAVTGGNSQQQTPN